MSGKKEDDNRQQQKIAYNVYFIFMFHITYLKNQSIKLELENCDKSHRQTEGKTKCFQHTTHTSQKLPFLLLINRSYVR